MARQRSQQGARFLAAEQEPETAQAKSKRIVRVSNGLHGNRIVPAKAPLFEVAAAHAGLDPESFVSMLSLAVS